MKMRNRRRAKAWHQSPEQRFLFASRRMVQRVLHLTQGMPKTKWFTLHV